MFVNINRILPRYNVAKLYSFACEISAEKEVAATGWITVFGQLKLIAEPHISNQASREMMMIDSFDKKGAFSHVLKLYQGLTTFT